MTPYAFIPAFREQNVSLLLDSRFELYGTVTRSELYGTVLCLESLQLTCFCFELTRKIKTLGTKCDLDPLGACDMFRFSRVCYSKSV